ncbi:MAG TPA: 2-dehydro-3-deoxy-D-gluconate 5-dehydrogenase KduD [Anaerolineae bacterium]|nr:2-dehydro-3-deoxy-D-gluconate 5-dehydrogenase KduD [Anaerolineae bacterium]HXW01250.1 2-dehydro-3-deoxy-D-gluconate 5-dehydrogenase KduD [Anaerolineae bacterium]
MILDAFKLEGQVALVTGAAQGLGQALALGLAEAGADIVTLDVRPGDETFQQIRLLGRQCYNLTVDLQEITPELAQEVIQESVAQLGRLDILVNNAGIIRRAAALEFSQADWETVLSINLSSAFYMCQAAARFWKNTSRGGKIINIASMLSFQGGILVPSYTAAKSGLAGLTRALANEWAGLGINVNAIAPGYMATDVTAAIRADAERSQAMLARIPANRWGEPADLKGAVVFLASAAANYLHGAIIPVDGGWLAR